MPPPSPVERSRGARAFDAAADATVAPGFSRIGYAVRSRLEHWQAPPPMQGRVVVVTGGTSGIGLATAKGFAGLGARVHLVGRDAGRARQAALAVVQEHPGAEVAVHRADVGDLGAVRQLAATLHGELDRIDVLVHGAGGLARTYQQASGGIEQTVATHVLGPFVLTAGLLPLLAGAPAPVVVWISSGGMYGERLELARLEPGPVGYDGVRAYARAKRAQVVLAAAWGRRFPTLRSVAMHPGWVDTPGLGSGLPRFARLTRPLLRTPRQGADTVLWLGAGGSEAEPAPAGCPFYQDRHPRPCHRLRRTRGGADGDALWAWCVRRTGTEPGVG